MQAAIYDVEACTARHGGEAASRRVTLASAAALLLTGYARGARGETLAVTVEKDEPGFGKVLAKEGSLVLVRYTGRVAESVRCLRGFVLVCVFSLSLSLSLSLSVRALKFNQ